MSNIEGGVRDRIGYVTFNRPAARNAVYPDMLAEALAVLEGHIANDEVRAIVLSGNGNAFCAGADYKLFLQTIPGKSATEIQHDIYSRFMGFARALKMSPKPTIAAVQGAAVGAGCEFAVACDFRLATPAAIFWENWIDLGIIPPLGGMFLLPRIIGLGRATDMIMNARKVTAAEALTWGLVSEVISEDFATEVHRFASSLSSRSSRALQVAKGAILRGTEGSITGEWDFNLHAQSVLITGPDFTKAVTAMAATSKPD